jgi:hypothetical protein
MLARSATELSGDAGWAFEPKLDGWRAALVVGASGAVRLYSRAGRPLGLYFAEILSEASALPAGTVLDGELVVPHGGGVDFAAVQRRIHPSPKRVAALARLHSAALRPTDKQAQSAATDTMRHDGAHPHMGTRLGPHDGATVDQLGVEVNSLGAPDTPAPPLGLDDHDEAATAVSAVHGG